jgi:uncharacterized membrane protein YdjX (TVP38/TMEM64 family)
MSIPVDTLVGVIGIDRAPLLMLVLGIIGGLTTFTGIPYHLILMGLAAGGATPWLVGLTTALGVMIGDSVTHIVSRSVQHTVPATVTHFLENIKASMMHHPRLVTTGLILYGCISPFSNDFVVASLTLMGYRYRSILIPLTLGNIVYNITLAYLGVYYYESIAQWLL